MNREKLALLVAVGLFLVAFTGWLWTGVAYAGVTAEHREQLEILDRQLTEAQDALGRAQDSLARSQESARIASRRATDLADALERVSVGDAEIDRLVAAIERDIRLIAAELGSD